MADARRVRAPPIPRIRAMSIRPLRLLLTATFAVVVPGCAERLVGTRTGSDASALVGNWIGPADEMGRSGYHQATLSLQPNGRFESTSTSYGLYEGQQRDQLSAWTRIEGSFRVEAGGIRFEPEVLVWWDQFEAASHPAPRRMAYPWGSLFDDATFVVAGNRLRLSYNVYPADAPIPVTMEYTRAVARD